MPGADAVAARRQAQAILDRLRRAPLQHGGLSHAITVTIGDGQPGGRGRGAGTCSTAPTPRSTRESGPAAASLGEAEI